MTYNNEESEETRLNRVASDSWYASGVNGSMILYTARVFRRFWKGTRCLEFGPAEGLMSRILAREFPYLTLVDGAEPFCKMLRDRLPAANVVHSLFEDFQSTERYDTIILGHVLEHVADPQMILRHAASFLTPDGVICCSVPNARSIHRQAAVIMGVLPTEHALNERDRHHGHRRVYDPESFRAEFLGAGLRIVFFGGYWIKPLSNSQIDGTWNDSMVNAFMELGERYPDIAAEIYVVADAPAQPR